MLATVPTTSAKATALSQYAEAENCQREAAACCPSADIDNCCLAMLLPFPVCKMYKALVRPLSLRGKSPR